MQTTTGHALEALDDSVGAEAALDSVVESDNEDITDEKRGAANARRDEFYQMQAMLALLASKLNYFKEAFIDPARRGTMIRSCSVFLRPLQPRKTTPQSSWQTSSTMTTALPVTAMPQP